jgi:hypothetical protein
MGRHHPPIPSCFSLFPPHEQLLTAVDWCAMVVVVVVMVAITIVIVVVVALL